MRRAILAITLLALTLPVLATEPNPSARQRELVGQLLTITDADAASSTMMDAMLAQIQKQIVGAAGADGKGSRAATEAEEMFEAFRAKAAKLDVTGLMRESYIHIYSKYFTEKELEGLIAFYSTPLGKKSIATMPQLMREGMEAAARELTPKIEQISAEVLAEQEKKRPWRRTIDDLERLSGAIELWAVEHDDLYPAGDYAALKALLEPDYISKFPEKDIWGHTYAYVVSPDRRHYRLVSAGADSIFEWDSRRIAPAPADETDRPIRYRDRLEDDLVLDDLGFVQLPAQAKSEAEN
jgi:uncharacterized protein